MVAPIGPVANLMYSQAAFCLAGSLVNSMATFPPSGRRPAGGGGEGGGRSSELDVLPGRLLLGGILGEQHGDVSAQRQAAVGLGREGAGQKLELVADLLGDAAQPRGRMPPHAPGARREGLQRQPQT